MAESHVSPVCMSTWLDLPFKVFPAFGPEPTAEEHAFHPAGRVGTPEDIAALVAFLVGPDSGFMTGAEFVADGGVTRKMIYPE